MNFCLYPYAVQLCPCFLLQGRCIEVTAVSAMLLHHAMLCPLQRSMTREISFPFFHKVLSPAMNGGKVQHNLRKITFRANPHFFFPNI